MEAELELVSLTSGAALFRQGDQGDSLYIVISGRLIVSVSLNGGAHKIIGTPGTGEIVGEMALLNDKPRSATVAAARDTQLAKLSSDGFARLSAKHPRAIFPLSRVNYLSACMKSFRVEKTASLPACVSIMPLASKVKISLFVEKLTQELGKFGATLLLSSERLHEIYGVAGASQYRAEDGGHAPLVNWLTEQETRHAKILYRSISATCRGRRGVSAKRI